MHTSQCLDTDFCSLMGTVSVLKAVTELLARLDRSFEEPSKWAVVKPKSGETSIQLSWDTGTSILLYPGSLSTIPLSDIMNMLDLASGLPTRARRKLFGSFTRNTV